MPQKAKKRSIKSNEENLLIIQRDLGIALGNASELHTALNICLEALLKIDGIDCAGIYLINPDNQDLYLAEFRNLPDWFIKLGSYYEKDSLQVKLIMQQKPIFSSYSKILHSLELEYEQIAEKQKSGIKALALMPIIDQKSVIGVLNVASKGSDDFQEFTKYALESIAFQIAGVLTRIQANEALQESQSNLKALFDNLNDFLFVLDDTGKIIEFNPVVKRRLGYSENELLNMTALDVHPPDMRNEAGRIISDMLAGKTNNCPIPLLTKDGKQIQVETVVTLGMWNHKNAIFGISRDITQRLEMERARQLSEDRLAAAIEAIDEGFALYDAQDRLTMFNAKYVELYKDSAKVIFIGNSFEDMLWYGVKHGQYPEAVGREEEWVAKRLSEHKAAGSSHEQKLKDGRWVKIAERKTNDGSVVGFRVDITDLKKSEEIAKKALKEKETLLREIHHRVKNNMQVISSLLSLQANKSNNHNTIKALEQAESRIHSMTLVHEILYQSEGGLLAKIDFQLYLERLLHNLFNLFAENKNIAVKIDAANITLRMDQAISCGLVVTELVSNSLKYAFRDDKLGVINIDSKFSENRYKLCIYDNGWGLPECFDWQTSNKTLGLRLVRELVQGQLEGKLTLVKHNKGVCWLVEWSV
ncbi:MAG: PAS domain S-box protein [Desulfamplus sp.]|nr:PAS domain S-box protein [Desulfamplus sp.]